MLFGQLLGQAIDQGLAVSRPLVTLLQGLDQFVADVPIGRYRRGVDGTHDLAARDLQNACDANRQIVSRLLPTGFVRIDS